MENNTKTRSQSSIGLVIDRATILPFLAGQIKYLGPTFSEEHRSRASFQSKYQETLIHLSPKPVPGMSC